jgi:hypothetical protein
VPLLIGAAMIFRFGAFLSVCTYNLPLATPSVK